MDIFLEDAIDEALQDVENDTEVIPPTSIDSQDQEEISQELIKMVQEDRKKADEIFSLFYTNLAMQTDRSGESKEAITKALELKIEASKNIIELLKIKSRINNGNNAIFFNTMSPKKTGVDINNIKKEI